MTGLTGFIDSPWFSVISVVCIVCVAIDGSLDSRVRVCLITFLVIAVPSANWVVFGWAFPSIELTALISMEI